MAKLSMTFTHEELAFYYNLLFIHRVMPYYSIMRSAYYIQIPFRKNSVLPYLTNAIYTYSQMLLIAHS